jgi:hypothetical protein
MHLIFTALRIYPWWALALAFILAEFAWYLRRKKLKAQFYCMAASTFLILTSILWFIFRGDKNSDIWLRYFLG